MLRGAAGGGGPQCVSGGTSGWMECGRFTHPLVTGNLDFTITGIGTPKAALIFCRGIIGDSLCISAVTGASEKWFCNNHSVGNPVDSETTLNTTKLFSTKDSSNAISFDADFVDFITDGIRINYTTVDSVALNDLVIYFFGGDALCAKAITHSIDGNLVGNTVDVKDVGFNSEIVFTCAGTSGHTALGTQPNCVLNFGITHNDGTNPPLQFGFTWEDEDAVSTCSLRSQHRLNSGYAIIAEDNAGANLVAAKLNNFDIQGFSVECTERTSWGTTLAGALCLSWHGNAGLDLRVIDTPTSTGTFSETGTGFQPTELFLAGNRSGTIADQSVGLVNNDNSEVSFGYTNGTDERNVNRFADDGSSGSSASAILSDTAAALQNDNTNISNPERYDIHPSSFESDGYTLNMVNAPSSARGFIVLAFASSA